MRITKKLCKIKKFLTFKVKWQKNDLDTENNLNCKTKLKPKLRDSFYSV